MDFIIMKRHTALVCLCSILIILSGCTGLSNSTRTSVTTTKTPTTSPITTETPIHSVSAEEARQRALAAEEERVKQVLKNSTGLDESSVGVYGNANATIVSRNESGAVVRVKMPYSYEYHCDGKDGNVDGLNTNALYHVTAENTSLAKIEKEVNNVCE